VPTERHGPGVGWNEGCDDLLCAHEADQPFIEKMLQVGRPTLRMRPESVTPSIITASLRGLQGLHCGEGPGVPGSELGFVYDWRGNCSTCCPHAADPRDMPKMIQLRHAARVLEVAQVLRRYGAIGALTADRGAQARQDLTDFPLRGSNAMPPEGRYVESLCRAGGSRYIPSALREPRSRAGKAG